MGACINRDLIMDWQNFINVGAGGLLAIGGWFCRQLWDSVKELKAEVDRLKEKVG